MKIIQIGKKLKDLFLNQLYLVMTLIERLQKDDGSWTYFANDLAYHSNKVSRKYDYLINILGADHAGYIKRIICCCKCIIKK